MRSKSTGNVANTNAKHATPTTNTKTSDTSASKAKPATPRKSRKKTRAGKALLIHDNPVSSPMMDKIMNVTPRKDHPLHDGEEVIDGKRYVLWKNYCEQSVDIVQDRKTFMSKVTSVLFPAENVAKLLHVMPTADCNVSPFKIAWKKLDGKFDAADLIVPTLKREMSFVVHHFDPRFSNNHVLAAYNSTQSSWKMMHLYKPSLIKGYVII